MPPITRLSVECDHADATCADSDSGNWREAIVWQTAAQDVTGGRKEAMLANRIAIDPDDIAGVVTSSKGPEAGVWVIAETTDLPTKLRKIVVTDDQGRYLLPDLPKANYDVWVRGYGLVDSPKVRLTPGQNRALTARACPQCPRGGAILSGELLVFPYSDSTRKRFSRNGPAGKRNQSPDGDPAPLDQSDQNELQRLSPVGQSGNAGDPEGSRHFCLERRCLGPPSSGRTGWAEHEQLRHADGANAGPADVCRLDRPHRRRRNSPGAASAADSVNEML